ncbi:MAG: flagellar biosynthesis protein FlhB [Salinisphaeraceae bacterium]
MAQQKPAAERTEAPTPKRRRDARKEGQIARSRELGALALVAAGMLGMGGFSGWAGHHALALLTGGLRLDRADALDSHALTEGLAAGLAQGLWLMVPLLVMTGVAAIAAPLLLGGWNFSWKATAPKGSRLDPLQGIKRMFSARSLTELGKALLKFAVLGGITVLYVAVYGNELLQLSVAPAASGIVRGLQLCLYLGLWLLGGLALIALVDVPVQIHQHTKELRMTRQEVRDELKDTEGKPEVKSRQRQLQQAAAGRRMLEDVPTADVVVTNPTHFAVALKYDPDTMSAPLVVASGADHLAARIRERAIQYRVPMVSAPPLARALYASADVGQDVPVTLYTAVAQLLTYVFQLRAHRPGTPGPDLPRFDLPDAPAGAPSPE